MDDMTAFERLVAGRIQRHAGPICPVDDAAWAERIRRVYPDLRQALGWSLAHGWRARVLGIGRALFHYWFTTGDAREAGYWGRRMLEGAEGESAVLRAAGHHLVSFGANMAGDAEEALFQADRAIDGITSRRSP